MCLCVCAIGRDWRLLVKGHIAKIGKLIYPIFEDLDNFLGWFPQKNISVLVNTITVQSGGLSWGGSTGATVPTR